MKTFAIAAVLALTPLRGLCDDTDIFLTPPDASGSTDPRSAIIRSTCPRHLLP